MSLTVMKGDAYSEKRLRKWLEEDGRVVVQTKRDEIRCQVQVVDPGKRVSDTSVTFTSASGKPLYNLAQWASLFVAIYEATGHSRFDCGVSINDSFDLTRRTVMAKTKPYCTLGRKVETLYDGTEPDTDNPGKRRKHVHFEGTLEAHFWLYDLPESDKSYEQRRVEMATVVLAAGHGVSTPESEVIDIRPGNGLCRMTVQNGVDVVEIIYDKMIEAGHEGAMIKRYDHPWLPKRCPDSWMKLKPEEEADGEIIGYVEGDGKYTGNVGSVTLRFADGSSTTVSGMSDDVRDDINRNRQEYLGRIVEIKYMQRDSQGGYRHPRWFRWHPDKTSLE